mgnify:CR=1 FL=1
MSNNILKITATLALISGVLVGTTACSGTPNESPTSSPAPIPTQADDAYHKDGLLVGPITATTTELTNSKIIQVPASSKLYIGGIDETEYANWDGTSSDSNVAVFVKGTNEGIDGGISSLDNTPHFDTIHVGKSDIVLTNTVSGKITKFTIEVMPLR